MDTIALIKAAGLISGALLVSFISGLLTGYMMGRNSAGEPIVAPANKIPTKQAPHAESVYDDEYEAAIAGVDEEGRPLQ